MYTIAQTLLVGAAAAAISLAGCQSDIGGAKSWAGNDYDYGDVQYFTPGPEFKLSKEAAAMQAFDDESAPANVP